MKMNKKKLLVAALALCLLASVSVGTLAWFSADDEVTNDFMIATSEDTKPEDIFSITVTEKSEGEEKKDTEGNLIGYEYKDILPGDVLEKEVTVANTGYYDQYVRVTVTVSDAKAWMAALNTTKTPNLWSIVDGFNTDLWVNRTQEVNDTDDTIIYTFYLKDILQGEIVNKYDTNASYVVVFTDVVIPESLTVDQAAAFKNNFQITVKAEAVQTENLKDTNGDAVKSAKAAFAVVGK